MRAPITIFRDRRWKNCGHKFTIDCVCFSLRSSRTFQVFQRQGIPQIWEQSSEQILGEERRCGSSVFPHCCGQYPVFWFLGTRGWHQHLPLVILGGTWAEQGLSLGTGPRKSRVSLQEGGFRADGPFSTSHLFVCTPWRAWCVYHWL